MTTEDRLRELACHGMTRLLLDASPKKTAAASLGGVALEMRLYRNLLKFWLYFFMPS